MRRHLPSIALSALLIGVPVLAAPKEAPKETLEATATRVQELEKANVVLQEDLARARLQLDLAREALAKTRADLDAETAARKALEERVAAGQQQTAREITDTSEAVKKGLSEAMEVKLTDLGKAISALATRHDAELAAMKKDYDARLTLLQDALGKETAAREALGETMSVQLVQLGKRQRSDRTLGWVVNGLILGVAATN